MNDSTNRRRGRPTLSKTTPSDLGAEIWIRVQIYRIIERIRTGKTPSVARTCAAIIAGWGVRSAVGGNPEALAHANLARKTRWRRFRLSQTGSRTCSVQRGEQTSKRRSPGAANLDESGPANTGPTSQKASLGEPQGIPILAGEGGRQFYLGNELIVDFCLTDRGT
jgi:hypothetical protein